MQVVYYLAQECVTERNGSITLDGINVNSVQIMAGVAVNIAEHVVYGLFLVRLQELHLKYGAAVVVAQATHVLITVLMQSAAQAETMPLEP